METTLDTPDNKLISKSNIISKNKDSPLNIIKTPSNEIIIKKSYQIMSNPNQLITIKYF